MIEAGESMTNHILVLVIVNAFYDSIFWISF